MASTAQGAWGREGPPRGWGWKACKAALYSASQRDPGKVLQGVGLVQFLGAQLKGGAEAAISVFQ